MSNRTPSKSLSKQIIADYLSQVSKLSGRDWNRDPFFQIGKFPGRFGGSDVSQKYKRYLYGTDR